ncbi:serine--tRNA synthetase-like protein Slimp isoform X1 [Myzus persicae]|uniref:serine--tRNA synthetase-like protein Slimp isoform X1 n=1 Tax=Myzus persicae TaxID=13164 RepID=UPI000B9344B2|nr:serine--tRNA synthetase-like protein Slimp isoform X1 [Myzus persicae]
MIKKLSSINSLLKVTKKYSTSKLYIPYNQTSDTYVVVEPYIDLDNRLKNINILKDNITLRGLNIDIDKICDNWSSFISLRDEIVCLNVEKQKLAEQLKKIKKDNTNEIHGLRETRSKLMTRLKSLRDDISTLEAEVVIPSLSIPNILHPECPLSESKILFQHLGKIKIDNKECVDHLKIGSALECLDFINPVMVYIKNKASLCEQAILAYFNESLEKSDFIPFCNSDLIKSVIVEGCGADVNNADQTFILSDKNLHLVGGASLQSFCAFLTKVSVGGNKLPMRLYSTGRLYKPYIKNIGLFSAVQTNAVEIFIGSTDEQKSRDQFDKMLAVYRQLYENIGLDYRIVYSPVSKLENWESLRAQVELYSVSCRDYIAVASLSLSGDFISKRLRIYWSGKDKHNFLNIVNGKMVDTNVLLGCLLEQNVNEFTVPDCLKNCMIV